MLLRRVLLVVSFLVSATLLHADETMQTFEGEFQGSRWPTFLTVRIPIAPNQSGGTIQVLGGTIPVVKVIRTKAHLKLIAGEGEGLVTLDGSLSSNEWRGTMTSGGEALPFRLRLIASNPAPRDRVERWSQDLDALLQRFLVVDRSFSAGERARFIEDVEALRGDLPRLDDAQVTVRIASAIALARNVHTRLYLLRNRTELRRLPIRVWWFSDGLCIVRTTPEHRALLGCRLDDFAGVATRQARDLVAPAFAGNPSWKDYMTTYSLTSPEMLHGFGITDDMEKTSIGVSGCAAPSRVTLAPLPLVKKSKPTEAWWDLSPRSVDPDREWLHVLSETPLPLYLRNPAKNYWFEFLPDSGLLYFQYNRASDAADETTKAFGERLFAALAAQPVEGVVVDLRFNTGGDLNLARDLMEELYRRTAAVPHWVLTGRNTFSAGISNVALWKQHAGVKIAGEPVGDDLDFWAEGGNIVLPNSGLYAHFANGAHHYSEGSCPKGPYCYDLNVKTLRPDLPASASWEEYLAGRDPMVRAVEEELNVAR